MKECSCTVSADTLEEPQFTITLYLIHAPSAFNTKRPTDGELFPLDLERRVLRIDCHADIRRVSSIWS